MPLLNSLSNRLGRDSTHESVYLPIDAKLPKDMYEQLLDAYDRADPQAIDTVGKLLETTIKSFLKKPLSLKYCKYTVSR